MTNERIQLSSATLSPSGRIDHENGILRGVSIITQGPARGHRDRLSGKPLFVDAVTLRTIFDCARAFGSEGVKVLMNHEGGAGDIIGTVKNFRVEGTSLRGDLHLLKSSPRREYVLEVASTAPSSFALSVAFSGKHEVMGERAFARCTELYSVDLVSEAAANAALFATARQPLVDGEKFEDLVRAKTAQLGDKAEAIRFCALNFPKSHRELMRRTNEAGEHVIL